MRVGFVGLGVMGLPMAGHLLAAGHDVAVWARRPESVAEHAHVDWVGDDGGSDAAWAKPSASP